ncbi:hypothetical protein EVJ32_04985 [Exiguobacterium sp. SH5S4]|uniref:hypothetical protein n=1 Tax=Exiguobacterium sp. SH5S4 TaxID=2510961 RepID=UPI00103E47F8|nr:hypothetical protein [Exiguobacterium sp. SH5S4]TCI26732.1 hypothetical protein EVJ32_04985 [Exiguobacterium sp. SH5S4]
MILNTQNKIKKMRASYFYQENGESKFNHIDILIRDAKDLDLNKLFIDQIVKSKSLKSEKITIREIRELYLHTSENPTLYVSYEDHRSIIAKSEYDIKNSIPGRRYTKQKDNEGEYVVIEHIRVKNVSKIKSTKEDWIYDNV